MSLQISQSVALVTGANRGIGRAFVEALHQAGAKKIYATARNIESLQEIVAIDPNRIIPLTLDVTNPAQIEAAATQAVDINLLINNAGIVSTGGLFTCISHKECVRYLSQALHHLVLTLAEAG